MSRGEAPNHPFNRMPLRGARRCPLPVEDHDWDASPPEYPWQLELPPSVPAAKLTEAERRRRLCEEVFEFEEVFRAGGSPDPGLVYDAEVGLYRFPDGRFALSREHADRRGLKLIGHFSGWRVLDACRFVATPRPARC